jgi:hypothetical protein
MTCSTVQQHQPYCGLDILRTVRTSDFVAATLISLTVGLSHVMSETILLALEISIA